MSLIYPTTPTPRNISHGAHLFIAIITGGFWIPFWVLASSNTARLNKRMQRDYAIKLTAYHVAMANLNGPRDA